MNLNLQPSILELLSALIIKKKKIKMCRMQAYGFHIAMLFSDVHPCCVVLD